MNFVPPSLPAIFSPGLPELLIFAFIVLLLFGKRLPSVMHSLGKSVVEFKKGTKDGDHTHTKEEERIDS